MKNTKTIKRAVTACATAAIFSGLLAMAACTDKENAVAADTYSIYYVQTGDELVLDYTDIIGDLSKDNEYDKIETWVTNSHITNNSCGASAQYDGAYMTVSAERAGEFVIERTLSSRTIYLKIVFCNEKLVSTIEDFADMDQPYTKYTLQNDIDLGGFKWTPYIFLGYLDGNGYSVKNLSLPAKAGDNEVGLFSQSSGKISNLKVESASLTVTGYNEYVGILSGKNYAYLENVSVSGTIVAEDSDFVGGVAGCQYGRSDGVTSNAKVTGCRAVGGVFGNVVTEKREEQRDLTNLNDVNGYEWVGGIAGAGSDAYGQQESARATLHTVTNKGKITGKYSTGGIMGYAVPQQVYHAGSSGKNGSSGYTEKEDLSILYAVNEGVVEGVDYVGGICGQVGLTNLTTPLMGKNENKGKVTGVYFVGGICGKADSVELNDLSNLAEVTGRAYVGGIVGEGVTATVNNCTNSGKIVATGNYYNQTYAYCGGVAGEAKIVSGCTNGGEIAPTAESGRAIGGVVGYATETVQDCTNTGDLSASENGRVGGVAGEARTVKNCVNKGEIRGGVQVGGVVGAAFDNPLTDNVNEAVVTGETTVGGVFGLVNGGTCTNAVNKAENVQGQDKVGGVVGWVITTSTKTFEGLKSSANVTGESYVGGVVGQVTESGALTLEGAQIEAQKSVTGVEYVGGILGEGDNVTISNALVINVTMTGEKYVGGLAGEVGTVLSGTFRGNLNVVNVNAEGDGKYIYAGGIAGALWAADNCINYADITVENGWYIAGIAGRVWGDGTKQINACQNKGDITGGMRVGGIVGYAEYGNINACINDGAISGTRYVAGICGKSDNVKKGAGCQNKGDVTAEQDAAGIFGNSTGKTNITNCQNTGTVTCAENGGDIYAGDNP